MVHPTHPIERDEYRSLLHTNCWWRGSKRWAFKVNLTAENAATITNHYSTSVITLCTSSPCSRLCNDGTTCRQLVELHSTGSQAWAGSKLHRVTPACSHVVPEAGVVEEVYAVPSSTKWCSQQQILTSPFNTNS